MSKESEIMSHLRKDSLQNVATIGFFENYPIQKAIKKGDTLLLLGESDHLWAYLSSKSISELTEILGTAQINTKYFASVEDWMKPIILKDAELDWELSTLRYVLPDNYEVELPITKTSSLDISVVDYIFDHSNYKAFTSKEYIKERIEKGISAGILDDGILVAWALTHDDNSIGFVHVLPKYRRKGYAKDVMSSLIYQKQKDNKQIYLNVEMTNLNAIKLFNQLGFILDRKISWIKLI